MIEEQALMTTLANQMISPPAFSFHTEPTTTTKTTTTASNTINTPSLPAPTATTATTITTQQQSPISQSLSTPPRPLLSPPQQSTNNPEPHSPLEDPDLVGPVAAAAARERRLYMAHELHLQRQRDEAEAQALREDSRRWDFLLAQMTDWKDREQSWKTFERKMQSRNTRSSARKVLFRFWK
ncbi:MAG: hypothetical protein GOMPHAMPRED_002287 [Gomphillus americanus]|uniref:Uncharacterized protein n=1 Tax=Gomphillus americanus TaxID=1940652 RepID=A0A8H3IN42_9LECA|nr:MAG: hypothetical protein GOMPHAMPRED_002287 [Gomphillus americanus]